LHFQNELEKILKRLPKIGHQSEFVESWKNSLDKNVKSLLKLAKDKIFANLSEITPCKLNILNPEDLFLLTKE
jgi:hypothetical protein